MSIEIDGACKQDGTPSPDNPVPIEVIEHPVVKVTGRNFWDKGVVVFNYNDDYLKYNPKTSVTLEPGAYTISSDGKLPILQFFEPVSHKQLKYSEATDGDGANIRYNVVWNDYAIAPANDKSRVITITLTRAVEMTGCVADNQGTWIQIECGTEATAYAPYYPSQSLPITLPAEHPYLAKLPDGTADTIEVDKDGNASLVARVKMTTYDDINKATNYEEKAGGADFQVCLAIDSIFGVGLAVSNVCVDGDVNQYEPVNGGVIKGRYVRMTKPEKVTDIASAKKYLIEIGFMAYIAVVTPVTYPIGKATVPSLPETISNVLTGAEVTPRTGIEYVRDVNIAFANIEDAIASITQG